MGFLNFALVRNMPPKNYPTFLTSQAQARSQCLKPFPPTSLGFMETGRGFITVEKSAYERIIKNSEPGN